MLLQAHKMRISFAVDAMAEDSPALALYHLMSRQWAEHSAVSGDQLRQLGNLMDIDYLLFGRVSAQTTSKRRKTEVTYTFNWKLGDCQTGLLVWADERERVIGLRPKGDFANMVDKTLAG